jgi:Septum formation
MSILIRRSAVAAALTGAIVLAGCQSDTDGSPSGPASTGSESAPTASAKESRSDEPDGTAPASSAETSVFDLQVGDCFSADGDAVGSVLVVDCAEPHVYEVFGLIGHEAANGEPYPGDTAILEYGDEACRAPFGDYVGHDYETSVYWITTVTPSEETWDEGDREIVCALRLGEEGEESTGSAAGSGQ